MKKSVLQDDFLPVRRALLSVSDKEGIASFARFLSAHGVEILSTGATAKALSAEGVEVVEVCDYTGSPEFFGGRVKTLHPKIHGGLLADRAQHHAEMEASGIQGIDMVVVNLYPFAETVASFPDDFQAALENIDIGGVALLRAGAKNHRYVAVLSDPEDYPVIEKTLQENSGTLPVSLRRRLAAKAFAMTTRYDAEISNWFAKKDDVFPEFLSPVFLKKNELRYGENPHQASALYADCNSTGSMVQLRGKDLSFNNIADMDVALRCVSQFEQAACVIVKHATPCGAACAQDLQGAYVRACEADSESAYGGIVAFNHVVDLPVAQEVLARQFVELVVAPSVEDEALDCFAAKPALRVVAATANAGGVQYRRVAGGILVQEENDVDFNSETLRCVTRRQPSETEWMDLKFAWRVAKYVRSNAIVLANGLCTTGIGGGQTSRVEAVRLAVQKSPAYVSPPVMASDAFFPFPDALEIACDAGVVAVIQPGGSKRDEQIVATADARGVAMVFTGIRHFHH